jgi:hypothetical protein
LLVSPKHLSFLLLRLHVPTCSHPFPAPCVGDGGNVSAELTLAQDGWPQFGQGIQGLAAYIMPETPTRLHIKVQPSGNAPRFLYPESLVPRWEEGVWRVCGGCVLCLYTVSVLLWADFLVKGSALRLCSYAVLCCTDNSISKVEHSCSMASGQARCLASHIGISLKPPLCCRRPSAQRFRDTPLYKVAPLQQGGSFGLDISRRSNGQPMFNTSGTRWVLWGVHVSSVLINGGCA